MSNLPTSRHFDRDQQQLLIELTDMYQEISNGVNQREVGIYDIREQIAGQTFVVPNSGTVQNVFRKLIYTGTLSTGNNSIAHSLVLANENFSFTHIYGSIKNSASTSFVAMPNSDISITLDVTNLIINVPAAYNGFSGTCVLEYIKNL